MKSSLFLVLLLLIFAAGCGFVTMENEPLPELDYEVFVGQVQPILGYGCGNPSCHGNPQRPFSVYAPQAYRLKAADIYSPAPLTEQELRENYDRARSFAVDQGRGPLLLTKPLAENVGGVRHLEGGDIFYSIEDRDYRILEAWIYGEGGNADGSK